MNRLNPLLFLFFLLCGCSHAPSSPDPKTDLIRQASKIDDESLEKSYQARVKNAQLFLDDNYQRILNVIPSGWAESRIYFDALGRILFYVNDRRWVPLLEKHYWDLQQAHFTKVNDREDVVNLYIKNRQFAEALEFIKKLPQGQSSEVPVPPKVIGNPPASGEAALLDVKDKNTLEIKKIALNSYTGLVIIGSPYCSYTRLALQAIVQSKKYFSPLSSKVLVMAPQHDVDLSGFLSWNRAHRDLSFHLVYQENAFPNFSFYSVPMFYFVKKGEVIETFSDWPERGRLGDLKAGLKKLLQ